MKVLRRIRRRTDVAVACVWTLPVIILAAHIVWSLVPFFRDDGTSQVVSILQTVAYFFVRTVTDASARFQPFSAGNLEQLGVIGRGAFYLWGVLTDFVLVILVCLISLEITPSLNRAAFGFVLRIRRSMVSA
ncbi:MULTISPECIES: hypothetical protein [unclassified Burkholderia]|uniref:hypothetical protein n=1 Tax=Burkholderia TaxID=32008 RepID=UPI001420CB9F|nr:MULTISPECIES: hypothetical protein [unclassified Burkholderia]NIE81855.1 hypothetical protein [Burkholderia sp. Tr-860]NIF61181.1 hypothetical protein [Burkholderia sp. Cy-647]NIF93946.1 hypothetical protein [Burkholderia sp. Ax-1720]